MSESSENPTDSGHSKRDLLDPHAISKKYDPSGRIAAAANLFQVRSEARTIAGETHNNTLTLEQLKTEMASLDEKSKPKTWELVQHQRTLLARIKAFLHINDKKLQQIHNERDLINGQRDAVALQTYSTEVATEGLHQRQERLPDPKEILTAYYEKMQTVPLAQEEKRAFLKAEFLSSLSTEEYIALWRRLNPYFLSHVTRQGFRDHNAMVYHSGGLQEFHEGFVKVLADGKALRSPLALLGLRNRDETTVRDFLSGWVLEARDEEDAKSRLNRLLNFSLASAPTYPDRTAVHFAAQTVANHFYGSESFNEIFFIYPSDVLASQHDFAFNGWEKDFTKPQSEMMWNDVFIWPQSLDNPGISIDAGFVFLPKDTPVDPATGSKYASEIQIINGQEKTVMVEDKKLIQAFSDWHVKMQKDSPLRAMYDDYGKGRWGGSKQDMADSLFEAFSREMEGLGFCPEAAYKLSHEMVFRLGWNENYTLEELETIARGCGAIWKRAENTIPSQQYWEEYFSNNPTLEPKHIYYYEGVPSAAVLRFQQENNIGEADTSKVDGQLLGFDNHLIPLIQSEGFSVTQDPRAMKGYDELWETASKIIADQYRTK